jgi:hypothetical protein
MNSAEPEPLPRRRSTMVHFQVHQDRALNKKWSIMKMRMDPRIPSEAPRTCEGNEESRRFSNICARDDHASIIPRLQDDACTQTEGREDQAFCAWNSPRIARHSTNRKPVASGLGVDSTGGVMPVGCSPNKDPITSQPIRKPKTTEPISPARLHRAMLLSSSQGRGGGESSKISKLPYRSFWGLT